MERKTTQVITKDERGRTVQRTWSETLQTYVGRPRIWSDALQTWVGR